MEEREIGIALLELLDEVRERRDRVLHALVWMSRASKTSQDQTSICIRFTDGLTDLDKCSMG